MGSFQTVARLFTLLCLFCIFYSASARLHPSTFNHVDAETKRSSEIRDFLAHLRLPSSSSSHSVAPEKDENTFYSDSLPLLPEYGWPDQSGYITINETAGAEMYFAFFEARKPKRSLTETPIILWLQGGPGCSSMVGAFYEIGPWKITETIPPKLVQNKGAWTDPYGVLFIDNPVGVGFSKVKDSNAIPNGELSVATDLYQALNSFFSEQAPSYFKDRPFFIAGESYAGKYIPSLGYYTLKWRKDLNNDSTRGRPREGHPFRLDGLLVGNGMTDPRNMLELMGPLIYYSGYIDGHQKHNVESWSSRIVELIDSEDWIEAARERRMLLEYIQNVTGLATLFNTQRNQEYHKTLGGADILEELLNRADVKKKLGVPGGEKENFETCSSQVSNKLAADLMKSVRWMVNDILTTIPVLLFQGQLDLKEGPASTEDWIKTLDWAGKEMWMRSPRQIWRVDGELSGYVKRYSNLTHVTVLSAGHMALHDQTIRMRNFVESWIEKILYK